MGFNNRFTLQLIQVEKSGNKVLEEWGFDSQTTGRIRNTWATENAVRNIKKQIHNLWACRTKDYLLKTGRVMSNSFCLNYIVRCVENTGKDATPNLVFEFEIDGSIYTYSSSYKPTIRDIWKDYNIKFNQPSQDEDYSILNFSSQAWYIYEKNNIVGEYFRGLRSTIQDALAEDSETNFYTTTVECEETQFSPFQEGVEFRMN